MQYNTYDITKNIYPLGDAKLGMHIRKEVCPCTERGYVASYRKIKKRYSRVLLSTSNFPVVGLIYIDHYNSNFDSPSIYLLLLCVAARVCVSRIHFFEIQNNTRELKL